MNRLRRGECWKQSLETGKSGLVEVYCEVEHSTSREVGNWGVGAELEGTVHSLH